MLFLISSILLQTPTLPENATCSSIKASYSTTGCCKDIDKVLDPTTMLFPIDDMVEWRLNLDVTSSDARAAASAVANLNPPSFVYESVFTGSGKIIRQKLFLMTPEIFFGVIHGNNPRFPYAFDSTGYLAFHTNFLLPAHIVSGSFDIPESHCDRIRPMLEASIPLWEDLARDWNSTDDYYQKNGIYDIYVSCKKPSPYGQRLGILR